MPNPEEVGNIIRAGGDIAGAVGGLYDSVLGVYDKFDGEKTLKGRHRSLELEIINGSTRRLNWNNDPYFDSGTTFWGPNPATLEPGKVTMWAVANRQGSFATGVTGGAKWGIDGTDLSVVIGFCNPHIGSYKHIVGIRGGGESAQWGYDNSHNEHAKDFVNEYGFRIRSFMAESNIAMRKFVYCIANA